MAKKQKVDIGAIDPGPDVWVQLRKVLTEDSIKLFSQWERAYTTGVPLYTRPQRIGPERVIALLFNKECFRGEALNRKFLSKAYDYVTSEHFQHPFFVVKIRDKSKTGSYGFVRAHGKSIFVPNSYNEAQVLDEAIPLAVMTPPKFYSSISIT